MINEKEFAELAAITVNEIRRNPKIQEYLLRSNHDGETAVELITLMAESAVKRYENFTVRLRTQPEFHGLIQRLVFELLREE